MVFTALNFIYHIYFPWLILWSKPQTSMFLTYHTLWLYYYDTHVVFSDLSVEEEIGIRSFSHPCPLLFPGHSFTPAGNYPFDIAKDSQILTVLSIPITLKRFSVETIFPPPILLGGWPPPKNQFSVFLAYPIPVLMVWSLWIYLWNYFWSGHWNRIHFVGSWFISGFYLRPLSPSTLFHELGFDT